MQTYVSIAAIILSVVLIAVVLRRSEAAAPACLALLRVRFAPAAA